MAPRFARILVLVLAIVSLLSFWRAAASERARFQLARAKAQLEAQVRELETEQSQLSTELSQAKDTISGQSSELSTIQRELAAAQVDLERTVQDLASLKNDYELLGRQNASLASEKQQLEVTLSSLKGLRQAIREVKARAWRERWATRYARIETARQRDQELLALGNRGYVVREGTSTLARAPSSPQMHVRVLEPQPQ